MSHTLRALLFLVPVQMFVSGLLLWGGYRSVREHALAVQLFLSVLSAIWVWAQLKHDLVI